ncbi:hypothetical protein ACKTEK_03205 [Tepidamorphus sp. 3E244]|uniref:hypothetical protein n=1 Tax=Tepidamorphus sp. 3E244 TaxID=3385498 RepID=UPI0038FC4EAC
MPNNEYPEKTNEQLVEILKKVRIDSAAYVAVMAEFQRRSAVESMNTAKSVKNTACFTGLIAALAFIAILVDVILRYL